MHDYSINMKDICMNGTCIMKMTAQNPKPGQLEEFKKLYMLTI